MSHSQDIFEGIYPKSFSLSAFFKEHKTGILGTLAFHLLILVIFLSTRIESFKDIEELNILLEYAEEQIEEKEAKEAEETQEEFIERVLEQQIRSSNRAVNIDKLEDEISTENYVDEVLKELNEERSEEWLQKQEELQKILTQEELIPVEASPEEEKEDKEFTGPTNIHYVFLSAPFERKTLKLPVPVYKCRGFGSVEVLVKVNQSGEVTDARAKVLNATDDPVCLSEVAEDFARNTLFRADFSAPSSHEGKITYTFIAQ